MLRNGEVSQIKPKQSGYKNSLMLIALPKRTPQHIHNSSSPDGLGKHSLGVGALFPTHRKFISHAWGISSCYNYQEVA